MGSFLSTTSAQVAITFGQTHELAADTPGLHLAGPPYNARYPVATFPVVALHVTPGTRPVVVIVAPHCFHRSNFRAVVAGENHERVVCHSEPVERLQKFAHDKIHLKDEIAVRPHIRLPLELLGWKRGQMDRLHRD